MYLKICQINPNVISPVPSQMLPVSQLGFQCMFFLKLLDKQALCFYKKFSAEIFFLMDIECVFTST